MKAELMVGAHPYDIPVRHRPRMPVINVLVKTEISRSVGADIVTMFAKSMAFFLPARSNITPQIILPRPLNTDNTPTRVMARVSAAPIFTARSLAKLITVLPVAARVIRKRKNLQNVNRLIISDVV